MSRAFRYCFCILGSFEQNDSTKLFVSSPMIDTPEPSLEDEGWEVVYPEADVRVCFGVGLSAQPMMHFNTNSFAVSISSAVGG